MPYCSVCSKCLVAGGVKKIQAADRKYSLGANLKKHKMIGQNQTQAQAQQRGNQPRFQNEWKFGGGIVAAKCGHLFHQSCLNEHITRYRTRGDCYGTTYNVLCPLCGANISNAKLLRIDIEAHFGILEEFFQDLCKLKYMNKELKRTLDLEWEDIEKVEKKIEETKKEYESIKNVKRNNEAKCAATEARIAKAIEDASTCYRYREIEKQLLDENINLEAVARRMENMVRVRTQVSTAADTMASAIDIDCDSNSNDINDRGQGQDQDQDEGDDDDESYQFENENHSHGDHGNLTRRENYLLDETPITMSRSLSRSSEFQDDYEEEDGDNDIKEDMLRKHEKESKHKPKHYGDQYEGQGHGQQYLERNNVQTNKVKENRNKEEEEVKGKSQFQDQDLQLLERYDKQFNKTSQKKNENEETLKGQCQNEVKSQCQKEVKSQCQNEVKSECQNEVKGRSQNEVKGQCQNDIKGQSENEVKALIISNPQCEENDESPRPSQSMMQTIQGSGHMDISVQISVLSHSEWSLTSGGQGEMSQLDSKTTIGQCLSLSEVTEDLSQISVIKTQCPGQGQGQNFQIKLKQNEQAALNYNQNEVTYPNELLSPLSRLPNLSFSIQSPKQHPLELKVFENTGDYERKGQRQRQKCEDLNLNCGGDMGHGHAQRIEQKQQQESKIGELKIVENTGSVYYCNQDQGLGQVQNQGQSKSKSEYKTKARRSLMDEEGKPFLLPDSESLPLEWSTPAPAMDSIKSKKNHNKNYTKEVKSITLTPPQSSRRNKRGVTAVKSRSYTIQVHHDDDDDDDGESNIDIPLPEPEYYQQHQDHKQLKIIQGHPQGPQPFPGQKQIPEQHSKNISSELIESWKEQFYSNKAKDKAKYSRKSKVNHNHNPPKPHQHQHCLPCPPDLKQKQKEGMKSSSLSNKGQSDGKNDDDDDDNNLINNDFQTKHNANLDRHQHHDHLPLSVTRSKLKCVAKKLKAYVKKQRLNTIDLPPSGPRRCRTRSVIPSIIGNVRNQHHYDNDDNDDEEVTPRSQQFEIRTETRVKQKTEMEMSLSSTTTMTCQQIESNYSSFSSCKTFSPDQNEKLNSNENSNTNSNFPCSLLDHKFLITPPLMFNEPEPEQQPQILPVPKTTRVTTNKNLLKNQIPNQNLDTFSITEAVEIDKRENVDDDNVERYEKSILKSARIIAINAKEKKKEEAAQLLVPTFPSDLVLVVPPPPTSSLHPQINVVPPPPPMSAYGPSPRCQLGICECQGQCKGHCQGHRCQTSTRAQPSNRNDLEIDFCPQSPKSTQRLIESLLGTKSSSTPKGPNQGQEGQGGHSNAIKTLPDQTKERIIEDRGQIEYKKTMEIDAAMKMNNWFESDDKLLASIIFAGKSSVNSNYPSLQDSGAGDVPNQSCCTFSVGSGSINPEGLSQCEEGEKANLNYNYLEGPKDTNKPSEFKCLAAERFAKNIGIIPNQIPTKSLSNLNCADSVKVNSFRYPSANIEFEPRDYQHQHQLQPYQNVQKEDFLGDGGNLNFAPIPTPVLGHGPGHLNQSRENLNYKCPDQGIIFQTLNPTLKVSNCSGTGTGTGIRNSLEAFYGGHKTQTPDYSNSHGHGHGHGCTNYWPRSMEKTKGNVSTPVVFEDSIFPVNCLHSNSNARGLTTDSSSSFALLNNDRCGLAIQGQGQGQGMSMPISIMSMSGSRSFYPGSNSNSNNTSIASLPLEDQNWTYSNFFPGPANNPKDNYDNNSDHFGNQNFGQRTHFPFS